jgi:hypothetical protein
MSYKQAVLRDNPIAFWPLNGTSSLRTYATILLEYATYQDWLNDEPSYGSSPLTFTLEDISYNGNHGAFTLGQPKFADILPLAALSNYDTQLSGCKIDSSSEIGITNLAQLYDMFYTGTENLKFGVEFWVAFNKPPSGINTLFSVNYSGGNIIKAYADNDKIYLTINGKDKVTGQTLTYTTSKQVTSWDSQMHVFLSYDQGNISISVNSIPGDSATVSNNFIFANDQYTQSKFFYNIGPSGSNDIFVVNDLAFYDYILSTNTIRYHMVWGTNDSSPQNYVKETSGFFFDIKDSENMFAFKKMFTSSIDYQQGINSGLKTDKAGLTLIQTSNTASASGSWIYSVPSSGLTKISGVKIAWDSGMSDNASLSTLDYAKVEFSQDNGVTWVQVTNGYPIVKFADNVSVAYPNMLVRVTISTSDSSKVYLPRIDNLMVGVYKDLSIYSDGGAFALMPRAGSYTGDTYTIKSNSFNVLARSENFGIKLNTTTDGSNSVAAIYPQLNSPLFETIEFWYRYDALSTSKVQYILDTVGYNASIYFSGVDGGLIQNGFANVYVNGVDISNGRSLTQGETYHFICVYPQQINNTIYLGGDSKLINYSLSTYGYLSVYPGAFSVTDAQTRYLNFLAATVSKIDYPNATSTIFGGNSVAAQAPSNIIGTLSEYSGTSTAYNGGQPILTYVHPINA